MALITSRHRDTQRLGTCIQIKPMEQDEAVELLLTKCNISGDPEQQNHAESIVQILACLPLAIDQAGAYISSRNLPLALFIDHFKIRKEVIMNYIPSGWPYQRAHEDQQCVSDLCVFTTWELSLDELGFSVDAKPFIELLTFAAFTGSWPMLPKMLRTQVEENLAAELGCRDLYTTDSKWDPWKFQDAVVQLYSVSLISEIDMNSADTIFLIHPLVQEWLKVRAEDPKDKMYIEAYTTLIHRVCDRHIERVTNFHKVERIVLCARILHCALQNGFFDDLITDAEPKRPTFRDTTRIAKFSEVFVLALPSFVECCLDCGGFVSATAFTKTIDSYIKAELGFVRVDLLPRFLCGSLCARASIALYDTGWLETLGISKDVLYLSEMNRVLEGDILKTLRPGERCWHRAKLLSGQVCIALGEIEAARQLLTDGFTTSQHTFGIGDVLTTEFQMTLAEVYIKRREPEIAKTYLSPELTITKSGRSDICAITARALAAKIAHVEGSLDEAKDLLMQCLKEAVKILGVHNLTIWQMWYELAEVLSRLGKYADAELLLRELRDVIFEAAGPEHIEVLHIILQLVLLRLLMGNPVGARQICQPLLIHQRMRHAENDDRITFTKAVLWLCTLPSGTNDSEAGLRDSLLKSLQDGSMPNPRLYRRWKMVALLARLFGVVDVASVVKKRYHKATELAFGVEYLQALIRKEASPEDSNNE